MRIIFVGIHNKPMKRPLDSSTKSGILIDRCIRALRPKECVKTNFFDIDYLPKLNDDIIHKSYLEWNNRVDVYSEDVVVLLGAITHKCWENYSPPYKIIKVGHPSSVWSIEKKIWYVNNIVEKVTRATQ